MFKNIIKKIKDFFTKKESLLDDSIISDIKTFEKAPFFLDGGFISAKSAIKFYQNNANGVVGIITATQYTGNSATATRAEKDSKGNEIDKTYATKANIKELDDKIDQLMSAVTSMLNKK